MKTIEIGPDGSCLLANRLFNRLIGDGLLLADATPQKSAAPYDGNVLREPTNAERIRLATKAGALLAAEIDRLQRIEGQ